MPTRSRAALLAAALATFGVVLPAGQAEAFGGVALFEPVLRTIGLTTAAPAHVGDFETGDLSQWNRADLAGGHSARIVREPVRQGGFAARFEVRPGDVASGGERAEVYTDGRTEFREGDELWFRWSTRFAPDFPDTGDWGVFAQWKQSGGGSPPLAMGVRDGSLFVQSGPDDGHDPWFQSDGVPIDRGRWHDFAAHVRFSTDRDKGFVAVWHDGEPLLERRASRTLYTGHSYLKLGLYRAPARRAGVVWHDGMTVSRTPPRGLG